MHNRRNETNYIQRYHTQVLGKPIFTFCMVHPPPPTTTKVEQEDQNGQDNKAL